MFCYLLCFYMLAHDTSFRNNVFTTMTVEKYIPYISLRGVYYSQICLNKALILRLGNYL